MKKIKIVFVNNNNNKLYISIQFHPPSISKQIYPKNRKKLVHFNMLTCNFKEFCPMDVSSVHFKFECHQFSCREICFSFRSNLGINFLLN